MNKILLIISIFFIISVKAMEDNDEKMRYAALAEAKYAVLVAESFDSSVQWNLLPVDVMKDIRKKFEKNDEITYRAYLIPNMLLPYSLRTINPAEIVSKRPNIRFLTRNKGLLVDDAETSDYFTIKHGFSNAIPFFDGVNCQRLALFATTNRNEYKVYCLKQSLDNNRSHSEVPLNPIIAEKGVLHSILLHREENKCVLSITNDSKEHCIDIKSVESCGELIASLVTDFALKKAIYIGNNTYLGLTKKGESTEEGGLVVFWLDNENKIKYAHQNCNGKQFKDFDVDETIKTDSGFMPCVALLARNEDRSGDIFLTNLLSMEGGRVILLYVRTVNSCNAIKQFLYDKQQYSVVYNHGDVHIWHDNFNFFPAHWLLKWGQ